MSTNNPEEASNFSVSAKRKDFVIFHTECDTNSADIISSHLVEKHFTQLQPDIATWTVLANLDHVIKHCSNYILILSKEGLEKKSLVFEMHVSMSTVIERCDKTKRLIPVVLPCVVDPPPTLTPFNILHFHPEKGSQQETRFWGKLESSMRQNMDEA